MTTPDVMQPTDPLSAIDRHYQELDQTLNANVELEKLMILITELAKLIIHGNNTEGRQFRLELQKANRKQNDQLVSTYTATPKVLGAIADTAIKIGGGPALTKFASFNLPPRLSPLTQFAKSAAPYSQIGSPIASGAGEITQNLFEAKKAGYNFKVGVGQQAVVDQDNRQQQAGQKEEELNQQAKELAEKKKRAIEDIAR